MHRILIIAVALSTSACFTANPTLLPSLVQGPSEALLAAAVGLGATAAVMELACPDVGWVEEGRDLGDLLPADGTAPRRLRVTRGPPPGWRPSMAIYGLNEPVVLEDPFLREGSIIGWDSEDSRRERPFTLMPIDDVVRVESLECISEPTGTSRPTKEIPE